LIPIAVVFYTAWWGDRTVPVTNFTGLKN
jgi:hypothetical protein